MLRSRAFLPYIDTRNDPATNPFAIGDSRRLCGRQELVHQSEAAGPEYKPPIKA